MKKSNMPKMSIDLDGEASVLDDTVQWDHEALKVKGLNVLPYRAKLLVICRESSEYDLVLMEGLVRQSLAYISDRPSFKRADELGISVLAVPTLPDVTVILLTKGRAKAVLFEIAGDFFLYSMSSAARENRAGDNDWTLLVTAVLRALRPEEVVVASISRLVRSFHHSGLMLDAITKNVDVVRAGDTRLRMSGIGSETDQLMWGFMVMVASSERTLIVQRLTAGLVSKYRRGEWVKGLSAIPLGYRYEPSTKTLELDESQFEALRLAWTLMCDPQVTNWQILQALGDLGVSTNLIRARHGNDATVADLRSPETYVAQLRRWSHLYLTGEHTTPWANPFKGISHLAGMPVVKVSGGREELQFHYNLGRPDISADLVHAGLNAKENFRGRIERGGAARKFVGALNQYAWQQKGYEYWLVAAQSGMYELRVRNMAGDAS